MAGEDTLGTAVLGTAISLSGLDKGIDEAEKVAKSGFSHIGDVISGALKVGLAAAAGGVVAFGAVLKSGIDDAREAAKLTAQTQAVITSTGNAAERSAEQVLDLASSLSASAGKSLFGDDAVQQAENLLLTFTNIKGEVFDAATAISVDMAQALGTAPKDQAIALGKALNDPIKGVTALTRVGVTFTDQQKSQIETMQKAGDLAGAQKVILAELNKEFGGSAEAAAKADGGWAQFNDRLGEAKEALGAAVLPLLNELAGFLNDTVAPIVENAAAGFGELVQAFQVGAEGGDFLGGLTNALYSLGDVSPIFDTIADGLIVIADWLGTNIPIAVQAASDIWNGTLLPAITTVSDYFQTNIVPILENLATALFPLVGAAIQVLAGFWTDVLVPAATAAWDIFTTLIVPILADVAAWLAQNLPPAIQAVADFMTGTLFPALHTVYDFISTNVVPILAEVVQWLRDNIPPAIQTLADFWTNTLQPAIAAVWSFITGSLIPTLTTLATGTIETVKGAIQGLSDFWTGTLQPALNAVWSFINTYVIPVLTALANVAIALVKKEVELLAALWTNVLQPALNTVWSFIEQSVSPVLKALATDAIGGAKTASQALADLWNGTLKPALDTIASAIGTVLKPALAGLETVLGSVKGWFNDIGGAVQGVIGWLNDLATKINSIQVPPWLQGHSPPPMAEWFDFIGAAIQGVTDDALPAFQDALGAGAGTGQDLSAVANELRATLTGVGADVYDTTDNFRELLQQLGLTWEQTNEADDALHNLGATLQSTGPDSQETADAFDALMEMLGITGETADELKQTIGELAGVSTKSARSIVDSSEDASASLTDLVDLMSGQLSDSELPDDAQDLGGNVWDGFLNGMEDQFNDVMNQVREWNEQIADQMNDAWDVSSPSGVSEDTGINIMLGLLQGLEGMLPDVLNGFQQIASMMLASLNDLDEDAQKEVKDLVDNIQKVLETLPDKVHGAIADAFDASADIDRQLAKNIDAVSKLSDTVRGGVQSQLDKALEESKQFTDPEEAAKFFQMRSKQILETEKLRAELIDATNAGDKEHAAQLEEQLRLIEAANAAEQQAFRERAQTSDSGSLSALAAQIQTLLDSITDPGSGPVHELAQQLYALLTQISAAASGAALGGGGVSVPPVTPPPLPPGSPAPNIPQPPPMPMGGFAGGGQQIVFQIDARGATMSAAEYEAITRRVLAEAGRNADVFIRTKR